MRRTGRDDSSQQETCREAEEAGSRQSYYQQETDQDNRTDTEGRPLIEAAGRKQVMSGGRIEVGAKEGKSGEEEVCKEGQEGKECRSGQKGLSRGSKR